jgi:hypothetical protein
MTQKKRFTEMEQHKENAQNFAQTRPNISIRISQGTTNSYTLLFFQFLQKNKPNWIKLIHKLAYELKEKKTDKEVIKFVNKFGDFPTGKYLSLSLSWKRPKRIYTKSEREGPGREAIEVGPELVRESRRVGIGAGDIR